MNPQAPSSLTPFLGNNSASHQAMSAAPVDRILKAVREHLDVEIAFVSRYVENEQKEITHVSSDLELPMGPGYRDHRADSYCWHIAEGRLPELIQDPADYEFAQSLAITKLLPVGCHLNTPLRLSDGTVYGSFCCLSRKPDRSMTERDMGVARAFAALAVEQIESTLEDDVRRTKIDKSIGDLIAGGRLQIVQQPIHSLVTHGPVGLECLSRFPDAGQRGPDCWFNEAAEIGMGVELEMLAIRCALESMAHVPAKFYVSINASPETILSGTLEAALEGHTSNRLVVEVTEHQKVQDFQALRHALSALEGKALIAIDDVGAGYSGLRHLVDLAPDLLKLDMSLTRDIHLDPARRALTAAMVTFAREIGSKLVAEGIECTEERDVLADLGVDYGQGYLFAAPMPVVAAQQHMMGLKWERQPSPVSTKQARTKLPKRSAPAIRSRAAG